MSKEISDEQYAWSSFIERRDDFTAAHTFKDAADLSYSAEELAGQLERQQIITVEIDGKTRYPSFQFNFKGQVYEILQEHLPRLLSSGRSGWDVCFWLFTELAVVMKTVRPDAKLLKGLDLDEVLRIGAIAGRLGETRTAMPLDLVTTNDKEAFAAFVEQLLNPDYRDIPVKEVDWSAYFDVPNNKVDDDLSRN